MSRAAYSEDYGHGQRHRKWFNGTKGSGFIEPESGGRDIFVHITALERAGISEVDDGQKLTFDVETGRDGREFASNLALA